MPSRNRRVRILRGRARSSWGKVSGVCGSDVRRIDLRRYLRSCLLLLRLILRLGGLIRLRRSLLRCLCLRRRLRTYGFVPSRNRRIRVLVGRAGCSWREVGSM
jgi:hypothetical protein